MPGDPAQPVGVVHYGLGPIGLSVAALVAERPWLRAVAAVDVDTALHGRRLGELTGRAGDRGGRAVRVPLTARSGGESPPQAGSPVVSATYQAGAGARVALHCTGSSLARVAPQLLELVSAGLHVISTTEELSFPWEANREVAAGIDAAARSAGVAVLGTGINPGFAMDYLPTVLSAVAQRVDRVLVHRVQDAGTRRVPLQRKIGAGMDVDAFRSEVSGRRLGHVGLPESAHALARTFGWALTDVRESIEPICATEPTPMGDVVIEPGRVLGLHQEVEAGDGSRPRITLTLDMAVGIGPSRDHVRLLGVPDLELEVPGGLHGDTATAAIVVNAIPRVLAARPGLVVMADLAPPHPGPPR